MWETVSSDIVADTGETVETYGIRNADKIVYDLSVNKERTEGFVDRLNRYEASAVHA